VDVAGIEWRALKSAGRGRATLLVAAPGLKVLGMPPRSGAGVREGLMLDVSTLPAGTYFVGVEGGGSPVVRKLSIVR
jgi:hypothetical protein